MFQEKGNRYMTAAELEAQKRRYRGVLAQQFLGGRHVMEIARGAGLEPKEAITAIGLGLMADGHCTMADLVRHGIVKPKTKTEEEKP